MRRAEAGATGPLWIAAAEQTGGRGRSGRHWTSPPGNLYASLILTYPRLLPTVAQLSLVAGLAAHDAVARLAPTVPLQLKWPNDVLAGGAKLAGILIEGRANKDGTAHNVVVGIGINLAHHPELPDRRAASLANFGVASDPRQALGHLSASFQSWHDLWAPGEGLAAIRGAWLERGTRIGTPVTVHAGAEHLEGRFLGLDEVGAMLLGLPDGNQRRITFGDVHIAAPSGAGG